MVFKKSESDSATLHEVFQGEVLYRSPLFQRHYVWSDSELNTLWEDIDTVLEGSVDSRFLGAIVLQSYQTRTASKPQGFWIIDGQQRLTTFFILIIACVHWAVELGAEEWAEDLVRAYLLHQQSSVRDETKLLPTIPDLSQFKQILSFFHKFGPKLNGGSYGHPSGPLEDAFLRHLEEVEKRISHEAKPDLHLLEDLVQKLTERLEFVQINLADHHDANEVFNRLNTSGQPLETIDLIRNEVFSLFDDTAQAEKIYNSLWIEFEKSFDIGTSKEDVRKSHQLRNNYFFPFALVKDSTTKKSEVFRKLSKEWRNSFKELSAEDAANRIISELSEYVDPYKAISIGNRMTGLNEDVWNHVLRLSRMPAPSTLYPYVMQLLSNLNKGHISQAETANSLKIIESFLVRRAFLGLEPTGLHAIFKDLWNRAGADWKKVVKNIQTRTIEFPGDDRFKEGIIFSDLYHRRLCAYVLEEYERSYTSGDLLTFFPKITIDHIMPQKRKGDWISVVSEEEHEQLVHTWGNLAPLSNKANAEKETKSWKEARDLLRLETVFASTKHIADKYDEWTPKTILARANILADWALTRWPKTL